MSSELASVEPGEPLYRLGRRPDPWTWPDWSYAGPDGTFGNRYDDPEASFRVLYASSQRIGAFLETLARFRPDLDVLAELDQIEGDDEPPPRVPRAWLERRTLGEATVEGRFVDVGDASSLARLRTALAASAIHYGLDEIDAATIRLRAPRAFTQQVSRFVYEQRDERGEFAGIRYRSRLGDDVLNWAVFEPAPTAPSPFLTATSTAVAQNDADLRAALGLLGLELA
jgi:RES domain-containing protein